MLLKQEKGFIFCNRVCRGGPWPPWVSKRFLRAAEGRPYRKAKI